MLFDSLIQPYSQEHWAGAVFDRVCTYVPWIVSTYVAAHQQLPHGRRYIFTSCYMMYVHIHTKYIHAKLV